MSRSIGSRLILLSAIGATGLVVSSVIGVHGARADRAGIATVISSDQMLRNQLMADMLHDGIRGDVMSAILARDAGEWQLARESTAEHAADLRRLVSTNKQLAEENGADPELLDAFRTTEAAITAYAKEALAIVDLAGADRDAAHAKLPDFEVAFSALEDPMEQVADDILERSDAASEAARSSASTSLWTNLLVSFVALVVIAVIAWTTRRALLADFAQIQEVVRAMGRGDLSRRAKIQGITEFEDMGRDLGRSLDAMSRTLSVLESASRSIRAAVKELGRSSDVLAEESTEATDHARVAAEAATTVDGNVQTVSSCITEMEAAINEIARSTSEATQVAGTAVAAAATARDTVAMLAASSDEVAGIVRVINSIAEQTNLLALNATIEAARAGEYGKGFAVVANEVKELARQTASATQDIARRVQSSGQVASQATDAIQEITQVIDRVNELQNVIAASIHEQTHTTAEIGESVSRVAGDTGAIAGRIQSLSHLTEVTSQNLAAIQTAGGTLESTSTELDAALAHFRRSAPAG